MKMINLQLEKDKWYYHCFFCYTIYDDKDCNILVMSLLEKGLNSNFLGYNVTSKVCDDCKVIAEENIGERPLTSILNQMMIESKYSSPKPIFMDYQYRIRILNQNKHFAIGKMSVKYMGTTVKEKN